MPDGSHTAVPTKEHHEVRVRSLDSGTPRAPIRNAGASGYPLFSRDGYLIAQKVDPKWLRTRGEVFLVYLNQLEFAAAFGWAAFDALQKRRDLRKRINPARKCAALVQSGLILKAIGEPEHRDKPRLTIQGDRILI